MEESIDDIRDSLLRLRELNDNSRTSRSLDSDSTSARMRPRFYPGPEDAQSAQSGDWEARLWKFDEKSADEEPALLLLLRSQVEDLEGKFAVAEARIANAARAVEIRAEKHSETVARDSENVVLRLEEEKKLLEKHVISFSFFVLRIHELFFSA